MDNPIKDKLKKFFTKKKEEVVDIENSANRLREDMKRKPIDSDFTTPLTKLQQQMEKYQIKQQSAKAANR
jgi:hypothetical protein